MIKDSGQAKSERLTRAPTGTHQATKIQIQLSLKLGQRGEEEKVRRIDIDFPIRQTL